MFTYEFTLRLTNRSIVKQRVTARNRRDAKLMAEAQTGGKVLGGRAVK